MIGRRCPGNPFFHAFVGGRHQIWPISLSASPPSGAYFSIFYSILAMASVPQWNGLSLFYGIRWIGIKKSHEGRRRLYPRSSITIYTPLSTQGKVVGVYGVACHPVMKFTDKEKMDSRMRSNPLQG